MTPGVSAPTMFRINGCGVAMYGSRDSDAKTGTYVSTWCLCFLFIPVLALRAYRVARAMNGGWYFIGREPLSGVAKLWNLILILAIGGTIASVQYLSHTGS